MLLNDRPLTFYADPCDLEDAYEGWSIDRAGLVLAKTDWTSVERIEEVSNSISSVSPAASLMHAPCIQLVMTTDAIQILKETFIENSAACLN